MHLPIRDLPFRDLMAERLGLPVFVDNDATAAMLAEWRFGAARECSDALLLTIGHNAAGVAHSGDIVVPVATLQTTPFGSGQRADEITIVREIGDRSAGAFDQVTPFTYAVP